jgi:hypothetical protein
VIFRQRDQGDIPVRETVPLTCIIREAAEEWFWVGEVAQQMLVAA